MVIIMVFRLHVIVALDIATGDYIAFLDSDDTSTS